MPHTLNKNVGYRIYGCEKSTTRKYTVGKMGQKEDFSKWTKCPRDKLPKGKNVQGTKCLMDKIPKGKKAQGTKDPRDKMPKRQNAQ